MARKKKPEYHYIVGAGQAGCLYDYGPNAYATLQDAVSDALWYLDGGGFELSEAESEALDALVAEMSDVSAWPAQGACVYFPPCLRPMFGDYIEISRANGPCPDGDDQ